MKNFFRIFARGLATVLPILLTLYLVFWLGWLIENSVRKVMQFLLPGDSWYFPGLGLILFFIAVFTVGLASKVSLFGRIWDILEEQIEKIPLIKSIYGALKDFLSYFSSNKGKEEFGSVVLVTFENPTVKLIGFTTGNDFEFLNPDEEVSVYFPMSYQVGGYLMVVKRSQLEVLEMSFEDGMRLILTAGVSQNHHTEKKEEEKGVVKGEGI